MLRAIEDGPRHDQRISALRQALRGEGREANRRTAPHMAVRGERHMRQVLSMEVRECDGQVVDS